MEELDKRLSLFIESQNNQRNLEPLDEEGFRQVYLYEAPAKQSLAERLKENTKCSGTIISKVFPIVEWLPKYKKRDIVSDVVAGLTVAVMHIPQGMAYALLGGVPPVIGIYMAFFPVLVYILMGTSRHVSMGTFAVVCMMVGKSVDEFAQVHVVDGVENSTVILEKTSKHSSVEVASAVCLIVGAWQVLLSLFRLGSLSVLLSQTLVSGFTTGAAVHVLTSQIKNLLGIKVKRYSGPFKVIYSYVDIFSNLKDINVAAAVLSASFITLLVVYNEFVKPLTQKKLKKTITFPIELIVVIVGTLLSVYLKVEENYDIAIVKSVPTGLPPPKVPPLELLPELITDGLIIAIVAVSINISMASIFAQKLGYEIDGNQEIMASGVGNVFSAFFSCMPYAVSLSRSLVQESAGGKTQLTSAVSALSLVFVLLYVGPLFEPLPYCILSTIIVVALKGMFKQMEEVGKIYRNSKMDAFVWVATFLSVVVLDISYGLGIGLLVSISSLIFQTKKFEIITLGLIPNTKIYLNADRFKKAQSLKKILVLQIIGGLHFANASGLRKALLKRFHKLTNTIPLSLTNDDKQLHKSCRSLVIDLSCVPFVDVSAIKTFLALHDELTGCQAHLFIAGCQSSVYEAMEKTGFFDKYSKSNVFHDIHDAVEHAKGMSGKPSAEYIASF